MCFFACESDPCNRVLSKFQICSVTASDEYYSEHAHVENHGPGDTDNSDCLITDATNSDIDFCTNLEIGIRIPRIIR